MTNPFKDKDVDDNIMADVFIKKMFDKVKSQVKIACSPKQ